MTVKTKKCGEPNCDRDAFARGRCSFHYRQFHAEERRRHDAKGDTKCKRKYCPQCRLLAETVVHVDVVERKPFEFEGREQDLVATAKQE